MVFHPPPELRNYAVVATVLATAIVASAGRMLREGWQSDPVRSDRIHPFGSDGPGAVLHGRIEIPFAAERALELHVLLELLRSQPGPFPQPCLDHEGNGVHFWHMAVTPTRSDVWWNAVLEPDIDWKV